MIQNPGRVDRSVATSAWNIPFSPTRELDFPSIGRREAGCSRAYCTESHRYCDERCSPSVPGVPPSLEGTDRARRRAARLEKPAILLLILLPWKFLPGTTTHKDTIRNSKFFFFSRI